MIMWWIVGAALVFALAGTLVLAREKRQREAGMAAGFGAYYWAIPNEGAEFAEVVRVIEPLEGGPISIWRAGSSEPCGAGDMELLCLVEPPHDIRAFRGLIENIPRAKSNGSPEAS